MVEAIVNILEFTNGQNVLLYIIMILFLLTYSIIQLGWWMQEMTMLYLGTAIISALVCKMSESQMWDAFIEGAKDMMTAAIIIGIARGVMIVLMMD